jgi:hypothetical protein
VCPVAAAGQPQVTLCAAHDPIIVHLHWVCEGYNPSAGKTDYICNETDFEVTLTVDGKDTFSPNGGTAFGNTVVGGAPCQRGYLIGWVVNKFDQPIKYDGLIGDAVMRNNPGNTPTNQGTDLQSYTAITIQADPALPQSVLSSSSGSVVLNTAPDGSLIFDGGSGDYQMITGQVSADVRYDNDAVGPFDDTYLILLTLDVRSGRQNNPVFVDFSFYNEVEKLESTSWSFVCWTQVKLTAMDPNLNDVPIAPGTGSMGTRKGLFVSNQAVKIQTGGIADGSGPVTLLALVQTNEGPTAFGTATANARSYTFRAYNNMFPVPTCFQPNDASGPTGGGTCPGNGP